MQVDFLHNQIIRDTVTNKFIESFNENLLPRLQEIYGEELEEIQFYEDHLSDGFRINGDFYYPLTLILNGRSVTQWIKWQVSNYRIYDKFNPYTYKGDKTLEFSIVDEAPAQVKAKLSGSVIYSDNSALPVIVSSPTEDKTFLSGKYSQCFVDEMAHRITEVIERELSIIGLADSGVVLELRFAPGSFLEHVVENTTYRRLLIKARGCGARDLWIKWTRLDSNGTYTINDAILSDDILFELAEDVPNRIKEKEYRTLAAESVEKYQTAMSRKNITEWREMMRRVIRRGEVEKLETEEESRPYLNDESKEEPVLQVPEEEQIPTAFADEQVDDTDINEKLSAILGETDAIENEEEDEEEINTDLTDLLKSVMGIGNSERPTVTEEIPEQEEEIAGEAEEAEEILSEEAQFGEVKEPVTVSAPLVSEKYVASTPTDDHEKIRSELEAKLRAELEEEIRKKHEEAEMLRARLEAQLRAETREKELMAEAARAAIEEQRRLEEERKAEMQRREEEERAAEARRAEEEARIAAEKKAEEERIRLEEAARAKAEAAAKAVPEKSEDVKYVSKTVRLIFRYSVSPNITKRIHEIILATIKYFHKEDVYIRIKATVPDSTTVNLEFTKIPENEIPLLVNIIKVLGKSELGIMKAILD